MSPTSAERPEAEIDLAGRLDMGPSAEVSESAPGAESPLQSQPAPAAQSSPGEKTAAVRRGSPDPGELMRLLRHPQSGHLVVEVGGRHYTRLTDIDDKETGQYVLELAAHLLAFTNGVIATDVGVKSVYLPKVGETPAPIIREMTVSESSPSPPEPGPAPSSSEPASTKSEAVPRPSPEAEAAFLASLQARPSSPAEPPSPSRRGLFGRPTKSEPDAMPGFNLADEINHIVQTRLSISPLASTTKLEILSDPSGGIRINVDGRIYTNPDDIPDLGVRALIKDSIKQWERS